MSEMINEIKFPKEFEIKTKPNECDIITCTSTETYKLGYFWYCKAHWIEKANINRKLPNTKKMTIKIFNLLYDNPNNAFIPNDICIKFNVEPRTARYYLNLLADNRNIIKARLPTDTRVYLYYFPIPI